MSTAAHEPRRVGPRRVESHSESKVTPRRNAPDTSEPGGLQYDSDELPVLIRLPNLRDLGSVEKRPASRTDKRSPPIDRDRVSVAAKNTSKQNAPKVRKKSIPQQASHHKLVVGGIVGGILIVVMLFLFNAGGAKPPTDQDGWANEAVKLEPLVEEPDFSFGSENEPSLYPGFQDQAPKTESAQFASGELGQAPIGVPNYTKPQLTRQSEIAAWPNQPNKQRPIDAWPSEEALRLQSASGSMPTDHWPGESLSLERGGYEYSPADSPSQTDNRSSMYTSEAESFPNGQAEFRTSASNRGRSQ